MAGRTVAVAALLAVLIAGANAAMQTDRTLTTSGAVCLDKFNMLTKTHYKDDAECAALIKQAMSTADAAKCPKGSRERTSSVQKCMSKNEAVSGAWVDFVRACEVMNVANRAGEAEAATERKPSCMPDFAGMDDFRAYVKAGGGKAAASPAARAGCGAAALAAAGLAAAALVL